MTEQAENRPRLAWLKPRFTIRGLLWTTALVAALFPAGWFFWFLLLNASTAWGTHAVLGTAVLLAIAAAVALSRGGAARAFWGGFAAVGFVYFLLVVCDITAGGGGGGGYYLFDREKLVTQQWNQWVWREYVMPKLTPLPGFAGGYAIGPGLPALEDFEQVAHSLWSLLFGCGGGLVSLVIWMTGPRRPARGANNGQS